MNALTEIQPQLPSNASSALMLELAKSLKLVAPITMSADAQLVWLQAAVDALQGIQVHEVVAISMELRRTVTRPSQIVPEVARLVSDHRNRRTTASPTSPCGCGAGTRARDRDDVHWVKRDDRTMIEQCDGPRAA